MTYCHIRLWCDSLDHDDYCNLKHLLRTLSVNKCKDVLFMSCWTAPFVFEEDLWSTASLWEIGRSSTLWRCSFRFALLGHKAKKPVHLATSLPKTLNWGTHRYTTISNISPICRFLQRALTLPTRHPARINLQPCQHGDIGRKDLTLVSKWELPSRLALTRPPSIWKISILSLHKHNAINAALVTGFGYPIGPLGLYWWSQNKARIRAPIASCWTNMELEQDLFAQQIFILLCTHILMIHFSKLRFSCWSLVMYLHCLHGV